MDFKLFIDSLLTGAPLAVLAALVGIVWQAIYVRSRDKANDNQIRRELELESQKFSYQQEIEKRKFEHQKALETMKFEYEKLRWREELIREITLKHVEERLEEYSKAWSYMGGVARNQVETDELTPEIAKSLAQKLKNWRYSKGGLLAEEITRDAAFALQTALWEYDGTEEAYRSIRSARNIFRDALRADTGIGEVSGQSIVIHAEERQKIHEKLKELQPKIGITGTSEAG